MKKILAMILFFILLFQMTSCYRYLFYLSRYASIQTAQETTVQTDFTYQAETRTSLESGEPLESYIVYNGITDGVPAEGTFRPSYRQGICRDFKGTPTVVLLFMDDYESSWTADEVASYTGENIMPALGFLKREAEHWGVELDFIVESYSTPLSDYTMDYLGVFPFDSSEAVKKKSILHASESLGFRSEWELYSYMQSQYPSEEVIFVTIFNKDGRSYAAQRVNKGFGRHVEYCTIYAKDDHCPAQTVAHEILHLYGAEDLYAEATSEEMARVAKSEFPNDIMYTLRPRWENCIDVYTAYAIGWTHEIPDVCYLDDWYVD
jgi:hypothetical protein